MKFWKEKFSQVMKLDWNEKEKEHIQHLIDYLNENPDIFELDDSNEYEIFKYKWIDYAKNELGWSMNLIGTIGASGYNILDKEGTIDLKMTATSSSMLKTTSESTIKNCTCSTVDDWCEWDPSTARARKCKTKTSCYKVVRDCGFLWREDCNGLCHLDDGTN